MRATRQDAPVKTRASEHDEQAALIAWCTYQSTQYPELARLFAIPNGGMRSKVTAARLKAEGVRRGVPDLCLPVARGGWHGMFIEMKTATGRETPEQRDWLLWLERYGYYTVICHGWQAAAAELIEYLGWKTNQALDGRVQMVR